MITEVSREIVEENGIEYKVVKYSNGASSKCAYVEQSELPQVEEQEPIEEVTQEDIQAELLLNQAQIMAKQEEQDITLAEILLGQAESEVM